MNNLKSAPSPWEPEFGDIREVTVCDADGQIILQCLVTDGDPIAEEREVTREEAEANAYLAAAAPDMYAALEEILNDLDTFPQVAPGVDHPEVFDLKVKLRKILRKARGENEVS